MDPDANWAEQEAGRADHDRMYDLVEALHFWLMQGGFQPEEWMHDESAAPRFHQRAHDMLEYTWE
jgi:hypothetical protein